MRWSLERFGGGWEGEEGIAMNFEVSEKGTPTDTGHGGMQR